jgi:hypothetical protein
MINVLGTSNKMIYFPGICLTNVGQLKGNQTRNILTTDIY